MVAFADLGMYLNRIKLTKVVASWKDDRTPYFVSDDTGGPVRSISRLWHCAMLSNYERPFSVIDSQARQRVAETRMWARLQCTPKIFLRPHKSEAQDLFWAR